MESQQICLKSQGGNCVQWPWVRCQTACPQNSCVVNAEGDLSTGKTGRSRNIGLQVSHNMNFPIFQEMLIIKESANFWEWSNIRAKRFYLSIEHWLNSDRSVVQLFLPPSPLATIRTCFKVVLNIFNCSCSGVCTESKFKLVEWRMTWFKRGHLPIYG